MPWWYAVVEREHDLQNPTSREKILLLGERLGLGAGSEVLDVASGRGGPAIVLAEAFGCRITCVEQSDEFAAAARARVADAGLEHVITTVQSDATAFRFERERYDAALCLGATFVWDGLDGTLAALAPAVRPGGFLAVGEPYWRRWPPPVNAFPGHVTLEQTVGRFDAAEMPLVSLIDSSKDDWDRYETLHWLALEAWLDEHPDDPQAAEFGERGRQNRDDYLRWQRDALGWAIFVVRKPYRSSGPPTR